MRNTRGWFVIATILWSASSFAAEPVPLQLETRIPLGEGKGRIDHLAADTVRQRLFVAELGNNTVAVVDLKSGRLLRRLTGFSEPQGIGYVPSTDTVFVANAADGSLRMLSGEDFAPLGTIDLGEDADNVRVDRDANRVFVGYGAGGLAIVDPESRTRVGTIPLKQHPEGFQLEPAGPRIFVNVPRSREIVVVDRAAGTQVGAWPRSERLREEPIEQSERLREKPAEPSDALGNFPMAFDAASQRVISVYRFPARLKVFAAQDGKLLFSESTCGDSDDVFLDAKRRRIYVSCGEGALEVFQDKQGTYGSLGRLKTVSGARTSLFVPELDRLYLAVRAESTKAAAIWVFRPIP